MTLKEENYLQRINELVFDDNAIVTCTSLSKILKIKVHDAQSILDKYVKNGCETSKQNDVSCTYVLIGVNGDNGISILLSKENELDEKKDVLKTIVSQHVYSVQKNNDIDLIALANVEPFSECNDQNKPLLGSVVSNKAVKRKLKANPNINKDAKPESKVAEVKQDGFIVNKNKEKKGSITNFCTQGNVQNNNFKSKTEAKSKPKNIMANFFSKTSAKTENIDQHPKNEPLTITNGKNGNNISDNMEVNTKNDVEEEPMDIDDVITIKHDDKIDDSKLSTRNNENTTKSNKKSKKRQSKSKSDHPSKRRKRIIEVQDSDSDIFASSESEIEVEPDINYSDDNREEEEEEETKAAPVLPTKARKMKQVTEEFIDEDGYMNTIQKFVMASDDDEEAGEEDKEQKPMNIIKEKTPDKKPVVKNKDVQAAAVFTKKEVSSKKSNKNSKGKASKGLQNQTSIMNFFKKT